MNCTTVQLPEVTKFEDILSGWFAHIQHSAHMAFIMGGPNKYQILQYFSQAHLLGSSLAHFVHWCKVAGVGVTRMEISIWTPWTVSISLYAKNKKWQKYKIGRIHCYYSTKCNRCILFIHLSIDKSIEITGLRAHNLNFSSLPRQLEHGEVGGCS